MQWRDATVGGSGTTGLMVSCAVELAKQMCRGCRARAGCLAGALERREACGVWGGELLMRGVIVPVKRPRGRPRKTPVAA